MDTTVTHRAGAKSQRRWYRLTPDRLVTVLLAVEGFMLLSDRWEWFAFDELPGCAILMTMLIVGLARAFALVWFVVSLFFRWRFQFSLRSLLLLVVVVAIPLAWMRASQGRVEEDLRAEKEALGHIAAAGGRPASWVGFGPFDWGPWVAEIGFHGPHFSDERLASMLPHLGRLCGLEGLGLDGTSITDVSVERIVEETRHRRGLRQLDGLHLGHTRVTDAGLGHLKAMYRLESLGLEGTRITDAGLANLGGLRRLRSLWLNDTQITDAGLEHIENLTRLQYLELNGTQITDAGVEHIGKLTRLRYLELNGTHITDAGLEHLRKLTRLQRLEIKNTKVTEAGVGQLEHALPKCEIWDRDWR